VGEAVSDTNSSQIFKESVIADLLVFDLLSDGRSVFASITLSEDEQRMISSNSYLVETSVSGSIELF